MKKKVCELCGVPARIYCESDEASLCWDCDEKVHAANFLVAKHNRTVLCHVCRSPTPWKASGPKLGRTISICHACVSRSSGNDKVSSQGEASTSAADESEVEERGVEQVARRSAVADDDDSEESRRHDYNDDSEGDESEVEDDDESVYSDDFEDEDDDDDDNENQVVPWTSMPPQATTASSSDSDEEEDNSSDSNYNYTGAGDRNFSEISRLHQTALFYSSSKENARTSTMAKEKDYTPSTDDDDEEDELIRDFKSLKRRRLLINEQQL